MVHVAEGRNHFYFSDTINLVDFASTPTIAWKCSTNHLIIVNDSRLNSIIFSFNGQDIDGEIFPKDKSLTLNWKISSKIWLASSSDTPDTPYRIWTWVE